MNAELVELLDRVVDTYDRLQIVRAKSSQRRTLARMHQTGEDARILRATGISAEAIVKHILKARGWTSRWKAGECTGKQLLSLLEDCREYGRARLRHEAQLLIEEYGDEPTETPTRSHTMEALPGGDAGGVGLDGYPGCTLGAPEVDLLGGVEIPQGAEGNGFTDTQIVRSITTRARGAVSRFFARTKQFLHELITAGALLIKGSEPLTENDIRIVDRMAKRQHEYLDGFEREVQANPPDEISDLSSQIIDVMPETMTSPQFVARAESYGNAVWQAGQQVNRGRIAANPTMTFERRYLGEPATGHCADCPPLAGKWVPVGTLPEIGDTECGGWCHCWFEYQTADGRIIVTPENEARKPFAKPIDTRPKGVGSAEAKTTEPPVPEPKQEPVPVKQVPKPKPAKSDNYPPARPLPSVEELIEGTGRTPDYYEEA